MRMMEKYSSCRSADTPYSSIEVLTSDNITTLLSVTVKINRTIDADNTNCRIKVFVAIMRTDYMSRNVEMLFIKKALDRKDF